MAPGSVTLPGCPARTRKWIRKIAAGGSDPDRHQSVAGSTDEVEEVEVTATLVHGELQALDHPVPGRAACATTHLHDLLGEDQAGKPAARPRPGGLELRPARRPDAGVDPELGAVRVKPPTAFSLRSQVGLLPSGRADTGCRQPNWTPIGRRRLRIRGVATSPLDVGRPACSSRLACPRVDA